MVNYSEAFKRPFTDMKKFLIGLILSIIPFVNLTAIGFQLECAKGKGRLPEWKDWVKLWVNGLLVFVIALIYCIPVLIVALIIAGQAFFSIVTGLWKSNPWVVLAGLGPSILAIAVIFLLTFYIIPSAVMFFNKSGRISDALQFGKVFRKAFTNKYFSVWIVILVYTAIASGILSLIPYVGNGIAGWITGVTGFTLLGELFQ